MGIVEKCQENHQLNFSFFDKMDSPNVNFNKVNKSIKIMKNKINQPYKRHIFTWISLQCEGKNHEIIVRYQFSLYQQ